MKNKLTIFYWASGRELKNHWARALMAMGAVAFATASSVLCQAVATGAFDAIKSYIADSGGLELTRVYGKELVSSTRIELYSRPLSARELRFLRNGLGASIKLAPEVGLPAIVFERSGRTVKSLLVGGDQEYSEVNNAGLEHGRNISAVDIIKKRRVIIIGKEVERALFRPNETVIGNYVRVQGEEYQVIGVFREFPAYLGIKKAGSTIRTRFNLAPISVVQEVSWKGSDFLTGIHVRAPSASEVAMVQARINSLLSIARGGIHDWVCDSREAERIGWEATERTVASCLLLVTLSTFCIGGFGIGNVMAASVAERVKEIGVRKALGASNSDVGIQLLIEAASLSVAGGLLGIAIAVLSMPFLGLILPPELPGHPVLEWHFILIAIALSIVLGIVFGFVPALKASRASPLEAFRV